MKRNESVSKAVSLLRAAAEAPEGETASALARATELPHPTAVRLIRTLEQEGFLARVRGGNRYVLGVDLLRLAGGEAVELLVAAGRPVLEELAEQAVETATLAIPRRESIEVVLQVDGPHLIGATAWTGGRFALHGSASGKVVLASWDEQRLERFLMTPLEPLASRTITDPEKLRSEIEQTRERGYATIRDELEDGLAAVGVPVFDAPTRDRRRAPRLIAVVNISGPTFRLDRAAIKRGTELARAAAMALERRLAAPDDGAA